MAIMELHREKWFDFTFIEVQVTEEGADPVTHWETHHATCGEEVANVDTMMEAFAAAQEHRCEGAQ